jgi:hypothetical protein
MECCVHPVAVEIASIVAPVFLCSILITQAFLLMPFLLLVFGKDADEVLIFRFFFGAGILFSLAFFAFLTTVFFCGEDVALGDVFFYFVAFAESGVVTCWRDGGFEILVIIGISWDWSVVEGGAVSSAGPRSAASDGRSWAMASA